MDNQNSLTQRHTAARAACEEDDKSPANQIEEENATYADADNNTPTSTYSIITKYIWLLVLASTTIMFATCIFVANYFCMRRCLQAVIYTPYDPSGGMPRFWWSAPSLSFFTETREDGGHCQIKRRDSNIENVNKRNPYKSAKEDRMLDRFVDKMYQEKVHPGMV